MQARIHTHPLIEHEALAAPAGGRAPRGLEVAEDAALELQHAGQAALAHVQRGLLAADAAGAEAHHGLALELGAVGVERGGEVGELRDAPVVRALEGAGVNLEVVSRVQHRHRAAGVVVALREPARQRCRLHRGGAALLRLDRGMVHADQLVLDLHLQAPERHRVAEAVLGGQAGERRLGAQRAIDPAAQRGLVAGHEQVDALAGEQDRALHADGLRTGLQAIAQCGQVVELDEAVGGYIEERHGHGEFGRCGRWPGALARIFTRAGGARSDVPRGARRKS